MDDHLILPNARPSRADALKNRELLLRTAQRLFAENGVEAVSMSAVAEGAGVGKGTLYRHFPNKGELIQELLDEDQRTLQNTTLAHLREQGDPLDNLIWFLHEAMAFIERHEEILLGSEQVGEALAHPAHLWWHRTIRGLLRQINPSLDADYTADVLYIMLDVRTIHFQKLVKGYDSQRIRDSLTATALKLTA